MPDMLRHEESLYSGGFEIVGGVDEAGRGPLAGPVCAAAVVFGRGVFIEGIDDSKKLSESKRGIYAPIIKQTAIAYSIAMADASTIDTINILQATLL
ncbi:MAG: ribonuclease HII, partial [Defluviitaleaceae bacterium]|nr:ribonuclease HII [Defluviitaleaceae bacterium]